jgi:hypothetical protein
VPCSAAIPSSTYVAALQAFAIVTGHSIGIGDLGVWQFSHELIDQQCG